MSRVDDTSRAGRLPSAAALPSAAVVAALVGLAGTALAIRLVVLAGDPQQGGWRLLGAIGAAWLAFTVGVWGVRRMPVRRATGLIVVGGIALQAVAMTSPPRLTNDFFRYAWDGRVQAAGISPYRYTPTDEALADLRTPWLFPPDCVTVTGRGADAVTHVCTRLNHPTSPTIYPPVAQAEFVAVHWLTLPLGEDGGRDRTWQLTAALLATATTLVLLRLLRTRGDPRQAVLWAWCPTVVLEAGGNAHVDALSALLVVLALAAAASQHRVRAGVMIGLAIATKLLPVLVLVALAGPLRRDRLASRLPGRPRDWSPGWVRGWSRGPGVVVLAATVTVAVTYLPHLLSVGAGVLGFLPGYLPEEGFDGSTRFPLLQLVFPGIGAAIAGLALLAVVALWVITRADPRRPWSAAMVMVALTFAIVGITYPWYALLLVPLVALDGRGRWLMIAAVAYPAYLAPALGLSLSATAGVVYAATLVALLVTRTAYAAGRDLARP